MRTFRVHFYDGNQKLYEASDVGQIIRYIEFNPDVEYKVGMITKIEEVKKDEVS